MQIMIEYEICNSDCNNIKPIIKFGNNNSNGCTNNSDCYEVKKRSICNLTTHLCEANQEENISELGEDCDIDANCIGDTYCYNVCWQSSCSDTIPCETLFDGTQMYCEMNNPLITPDTYCQELCYSDSDCFFLPNRISSSCNLTTNHCEYEVIR